MIIRLKEEDGKFVLKSFFHPLVPFMLFMGGLFIILIFVLTGIEDKAFPFLSTGKPLGLPGLFPVLFFFASLSGFSYRNTLIADSRQIELKTGAFFLMETKTKIATDKCEGLYLQSSGKGKMIMFVKVEDSYYNTFMMGSAGRITGLAEKIASVTGLKLSDIAADSGNKHFKGKMKIFMKKAEAETDAETETAVESE